MPTLEFFYDYASPYTYLASTRVDELARKCGAELIRKPILLGGLFKAVGNTMPAAVLLKGKYMLTDLHEWSSYLGVPFQFPDFFPVNSLKAMRGAVHALQQGKQKAYDDACFRAVWLEGVNITNEGPLADLAQRVGLDRAAFVAALSDPAIKQSLIERTDELASRGGFGLPTFFVNGEKMYFGNDRMMFVERALGRAGR